MEKLKAKLRVVEREKETFQEKVGLRASSLLSVPIHPPRRAAHRAHRARVRSGARARA
jgi:hypothetical protein